MASDPWNAFGSDSEDESTETSAAPPPPPLAQSAARARAKKQRLWEGLLPSFDGCVTASSQENTLIAPRELHRGVEAGPMSGSGAGDNANGDMTGEQPSVDHQSQRAGTEATAGATPPFSAPPVFQSPFMRYSASMPHRGGGRGFVAAEDIPPGTLLLKDRRFLPMPTAKDCAREGGMPQEELCLKWILALSAPKLAEVLSEMQWLHPQSLDDLPKDEVEGLMARYEEFAQTMTASLGQAGAGDASLDVRGIIRLLAALQSNGFASGIYLHPAMTNHSCRPNAIKWQAGRSIADGRHRAKRAPDAESRGEAATGGASRGGDQLSEIRATEFIRKGQEITISYLQPLEIARGSRQHRLQEQFGFNCDCRLCRPDREGTGEQRLEAYVTEDQNQQPEEHGTSGVRASEKTDKSGTYSENQSKASEHPGQHDPQRREITSASTGGEVSRTQDKSGEGEGRRISEGDDRERGTDAAGETQPPEKIADDGSEDDDDDLATRGLVTMNVLERRLEAVESVLELSRSKEIRWQGVLSELLEYRRQAARILHPRHITLARADKLIARACDAILQGPIDMNLEDADCGESVRRAAHELPASFGGILTDGGHTRTAFRPREDSKTLILAVLVAVLLSRRKTQLLYLGPGPHPEAGECLADLSQAMGMLLAQGSEGERWIRRLPSSDKHRSHVDVVEGPTHGSWWEAGGTSASLFERACDKAARRIAALFDDPRAR